jgi:hypothetical protein
LFLVPAFGIAADGVSNHANFQTLAERAAAHFEKGGLSDEDTNLFRQVERGEIIDFAPPAAGLPAKLNARFITWLCRDDGANAALKVRGLDIRNANIEGDLDLNRAHVTFPLRFTKCTFSGSIQLEAATLSDLVFTRSKCKSIAAKDFTSTGNVYLDDGFLAREGVSLVGATIERDFVCSGGSFLNIAGSAFAASGIKVLGNVYLDRKFYARGTVDFHGATVTGQLSCDNARLFKPSGVAFIGDDMEVGRNLVLRAKCEAQGDVRLIGARITGDFSCIGGKFVAGESHAIDASTIRVGGNVYLREEFRAEGAVSFYGAQIDGMLDFQSAVLSNQDGYAIDAPYGKIGGDLMLSKGASVKGEINLIGTMIGGNIDLSSGKFVAPLVAQSRGISFNCVGTRVEGNVLCTGDCRIEGEAKFYRSFVAGGFLWHEIKDPHVTRLNLELASFAAISTEKNSWRACGEISMNGLVYGQIQEIDAGYDRDITWFVRTGDSYQPQPFTQLASVLKGAGDRDRANEVLIAMEDERWSGWWSVLWPFCHLTGYGYRPWNVVFYGVLVIAISSLIFAIGFREKAIVATQLRSSLFADQGYLPPGYPEFNAVKYAIDVFLPIQLLSKFSSYFSIIEVEQKSHWQMNTTSRLGRFLNAYRIGLLTLGWIFALALVFGLNGWLRSQ